MNSIINLVKTENEGLDITDCEARLIIGKIKHLFEDYLDIDAVSDYIKGFIKNHLVVYRNQVDIFNWFYSDEGKEDIVETILTYEIDKDMVGSSMLDIILENKENYAKVTNNLYISWWNL